MAVPSPRALLHGGVTSHDRELALRQARFDSACGLVLQNSHNRGGIGTLGEKTLHAALKYYLEPDPLFHEVKTGPYIADIFRDGSIVEIQTRGFSKMKAKLEAFLPHYRVTVVYPIAQLKWLIWLDPESGETTKKRKSPKRGVYQEAFFELYWIRNFLAHPNLYFHLLLLEVEEYRLLNGWNDTRKRGASRYERIPLRLNEELLVGGNLGYGELVPPSLSADFTTKDFAGASGISPAGAQRAVNSLLRAGALERTGKQGRLYTYRTLG